MIKEFRDAEPANKSTKAVDITTHLNSIDQVEKNYSPNMGTGACTVPGCGCTQFKDIGGTCWNLNSAGGTCNHLAADHG